MAPSTGQQTTVAFLTCQRCAQPLQLDESLSDEALASAASSSSNEGLGKSRYDVISAAIPKHTDPQTRAKAAVTAPPVARDAKLRDAVTSHYRDTSAKDSSQANASNSLSTQLSLHQRLFDLISSVVPISNALPSTSTASTPINDLALGIDHPLCLDCSDYCLEVIRKQVEEVRRERDSLREYNAELEKHLGSETEIKKMENELEDLQDLVRKAVASLYKSEQTKKGLEAELEQLELEEKELEAEEAEFWAAHSKLLSEMTTLESTKASLTRSIAVSQSTLDRLNATNVFYDAFCIGHEGGGVSSSRKRSSGPQLGTINGLRFGRVSTAATGASASSTTVEWNEVNAAWGQVALLLDVLRSRIGALHDGQAVSLTEPSVSRGKEFVGWRLKPKGSTSSIVRLPNPAASGGAAQQEDVFELYHPGPWNPVTRMLHSRRFDAAMVGVLDCTSQLFDWAEVVSGRDVAHSPAPRMIHAINGERIGDISIRLAGAFGFTSEETWSRALKYLLVNLQVLMHWATQDETVPVPLPETSS